MEDEIVGWHQRLNGQESEQALGDGEGKGSLVCMESQRGGGGDGGNYRFSSVQLLSRV